MKISYLINLNLTKLVKQIAIKLGLLAATISLGFAQPAPITQTPASIVSQPTQNALEAESAALNNKQPVVNPASGTTTTTTTVTTDQIPGCSQSGFVVKNWILYLNSDNNKNPQRIFIIQSSTPGILIINQANLNTNTNLYANTAMQTPALNQTPGFPVHLHNGLWSAYATNQRNIPLSCMTYSPPRFGYSDCLHALSICSYTPTSNPGIQWLVQEVPFGALITNLQQHNLLPPRGS